MDAERCYRITVRGRLGERTASALEGMRIEAGDGSTALVGVLRDQAELYGFIERLRDLGLELLRVEAVAS